MSTATMIKVIRNYNKTQILNTNIYFCTYSIGENLENQLDNPHSKGKRRKFKGIFFIWGKSWE